MAVAYASGLVVIRDATTGALLQTLAGHFGPLRAMTITSDGKRLATARLTRVTVWDTTTGAQLHQLESSSGFSSLSYAPDDATLVTSAAAGIVTQWSALDGRSNWRTVLDDGVDSIHHLPDGSGVVVSKGGSLVTLSASNGTVAHEVRLGAGILGGGIVGISSDGKYAMGSLPNRVSAWSLETGASKWVVDSGKHQGRAYAVEPQGQFVVVTRPRPTLAADQPKPLSTTVALLRVTDGEVLNSISVAGENTAMAVLPGSQKIAFGTASGTIDLLDLVSGTSSPMLAAPADRVHALAPSTGSARELYTDVDQFNIWSEEEDAVKQINLTSRWPVNESLALSPNGSVVAVLKIYGIESRRQEVRLLSVPEGQPLATFRRDVTSASFSPDGQKVLTTCHCAGKGQSIQEWSLAGHLLASFGDSNLNVSSAVFAPDGTRLAVIAASGATSTGIVGMLDLRTNQMLWTAGPGHEGALRGLRGNLAFSPDGTMLAFKDLRPVGTGAVTVFNSSSGAVIKHMSLPEGNDSGLAFNERTGMPWYYSGGTLQFSPDQSYLAVGGSKGVHVWRTSDWRRHDPIEIPADSLVFDRKRGTLMITDVDGSLRKWCGVGAGLSR
ncbi:MAG: WD40 repeat domain-containing protein [Deltaproteobacteria bacterium]|nr:WD40 repeat domain-containing protein [Deltaproteobacteria bacterium]